MNEPDPARDPLAPRSTLAARDEWAVDLTNVSKVFAGKVHALRGIDIRVRRGEIFGLLGPNGAGKSTLVKILMTVIRPTSAQGTMLGQHVGHKPTLGRVGYLPEHHRFPDYLTGAQVVDFYGALAGVSHEDRKARVPELLDVVGMKDWAGAKVKGYSKGMRQRVGIAQALVNNPDLVLLDEPTDGVDPVGRRDIREICRRMRDQGKTVFINSHLLSELEMVCDRVAILVKGTVASQGTIDELTKDKQYYELEVQAESTQEVQSLLAAALPSVGLLDLPPALPERASAGPSGHATPARPGPLTTLADGIPVFLLGSTLRVGTTDASRMQPLVDAIRARGGTIKSLRPVRPSLEDLFMQAVTDPATGQTMTPGAELNTKEAR